MAHMHAGARARVCRGCGAGEKGSGGAGMGRNGGRGTYLKSHSGCGGSVFFEARAIDLRDEHRWDGNAREIADHVNQAWLVVDDDHRNRPSCLRVRRLDCKRASATIYDRNAALDSLGVDPAGIASVVRLGDDERRVKELGHLRRKARLLARVQCARALRAEEDLCLGARLEHLACQHETRRIRQIRIKGENEKEGEAP